MTSNNLIIFTKCKNNFQMNLPCHSMQASILCHVPCLGHVFYQSSQPWLDYQGNCLWFHSPNFGLRCCDSLDFSWKLSCIRLHPSQCGSQKEMPTCCCWFLLEVLWSSCRKFSPHSCQSVHFPLVGDSLTSSSWLFSVSLGWWIWHSTLQMRVLVLTFVWR